MTDKQFEKAYWMATKQHELSLPKNNKFHIQDVDFYESSFKGFDCTLDQVARFIRDECVRYEPVIDTDKVLLILANKNKIKITHDTLAERMRDNNIL